MSSEWVTKALDKFILLQRGHDLPADQRVKGDIPVAGSQGITGFHNESIGIVPGLTIGRSGSIGATQFFKSKYYPLNTTLYATDFLGNDPLYSYYYFKNFDFSPYNSGSVQPSLNRNFLYTADVDIPPLHEQKAIAHILETLDSKIELNRKTNETLESIAKALFKSWFVDFDPVTAKAEGQTTGLPDEISELFPDSFEESELGKIPSGWSVVGLSHYLLLQRGFDLPAKQRIKGAYPVVAASGISSSHNSPMAKAPGVVTGRSGVLGNVFYVQEDFFPLNTTLWVKEFYSATPVFGYFLLGTIDFSVFNAGSAVPTLNRNHLGSLRFASPPDSLIKCFTKIAVPLMESLDLNSRQEETLKQIMNAVLPRLISGKLRVPDAEKLLEEVGI